MKTLLRFGLFFALYSTTMAQPVSVQKTPAPANVITADLVFGNGRDLTATGTGTITATALTAGATIPGALVFADGVRQTFNPNGTTPGFNPGSNAGDPSAPSNGDLWYDSTGNLLRARINSITVSLAAGGGSSPLTTKGDVYTFSTVDARLGVGTNGQVLTADSVETTGLKWTTIAAGGTVTNTGTLTADQVVVGNGTADVKILAAGTNTHILTMTAGVPGWAAPGGGSGTVTHTAGALTSNAVMLGAGAADSKVVAGIFSDGTSKVTLGQTGTSVGGLLLANATSGTVELAPVTGALGTSVISVPAATDTMALLAATQTFTAKTLTAPRIGTSILDTNGNELFLLTATASAVNELTIANAATGNNPTITASGGNTDVGINLVAKGTGILKFTSGATGNGQFTIDTVAGPAFSILKFDIVGVNKGLFGATTSANGLITGTAAGDVAIRTAGSILFSGDDGTSAGLKIFTSTGQVSAEKTIASTTTATGALISKGGLGVAGAINAGGNIVTQTIGTTLGVKSGTNAKSGTFTLASGAATLSNTSITANSVLVCWLKTASGAITLAPYATAVTVGTSYTIAGGVGDNSTYNFIILEVN